MKKITFLCSFLLLSSSLYGCMHDKLDIKLDVVEDPQPRSRILATDYEDIRIAVDYTHLTTSNSTLLNYIKQRLMPPAINYFKKALKVPRLTSKLQINYDTVCGLDTPAKYINTGADADLVILVTGESTSESFLAWARACLFLSSTNRPVFGQINFNYMYIARGNDGFERDYLTTLHEMFHVFGFSSSLYSQYIDPVTQTKLTNVYKVVAINGVNYPFVDVEPLTSRLRTYFGCSDLEGAMLEDQGGASSASSHFERRVFLNEIMTASEIDDARISEFTLALMEGTGWYQVDYTMTEPFFWGKGRGCNFIRDSCVQNGGTPNFPEFCPALRGYGCTNSGRSQAYCGATQILTQSSLSSSLNYWNNKTVIFDSFANNCPYYAAYANLDCEDSAAKKNAELPSVESYEYGSRCFSGSFQPDTPSSELLTYCFQFQCQEITTGNYKLTVNVGSTNVECTAQGTVNVPGFSGTLNCPNPNTYCTTSGLKYCRRGCSGNGNCQFAQCVCSEGWNGNDCSNNLNAYVEEPSDEPGTGVMTYVLVAIGAVAAVGLIGFLGFKGIKRWRLKKASQNRANHYRGDNTAPSSNRQTHMPQIPAINSNITYQNPTVNQNVYVMVDQNQLAAIRGQQPVINRPQRPNGNYV